MLVQAGMEARLLGRRHGRQDAGPGASGGPGARQSEALRWGVGRKGHDGPQSMTLARERDPDAPTDRV